MKQLIFHDVVLAYPNFTLPFRIYTDASDYQLGAMIIQNNRSITFCRKFNGAQWQYSLIKKELLNIVETLKEFKGILFGQQIKALGLGSNWVKRIAGITNIVADAITTSVMTS